jgi:2'-5' RNA ligase
MAAVGASWRCFVAVPIGEGLRAALRAFVGQLRSDGSLDADWRWTDADGWHMTVAFLGSTEPAWIPELADALAGLAADSIPFSLAGAGLGAFPSQARARALWYGFDDPGRRLRQLADRVAPAVGLPRDDRFRPHLTLARARDRRGTDASTVLAAAAPSAELPVDRLVLYRSHRGRGPARYEALATATLGGSA